MKADLIPIACSAAMAIMAGAAASHFASVQQMVHLAQTEAAPLPLAHSDKAESGKLLELIAHLREQNHLLRENIQSASQGAQRSAMDAPPVLAAADASPRDLQRLLSEIIAQNHELQTKLAETNRDVMALEFRVDSHSEQFRPLNLENGSEYPIASPVAPTDYIENISQDLRNDIGVLPPLDESDYTQ